jgi:hypothetical protein
LHPGEIKGTEEEVMEKLRVKTKLCITRKNLPFVIGGTND